MAGQTQGAPSGGHNIRFALPRRCGANVFESPASPLTSLTLGIGMNRIADFNTRYSFSSESRYDPSKPDQLMPTIADGLRAAGSGRMGFSRIRTVIWATITILVLAGHPL